ncbi:protein of unknown function [Bradyrhizobium sp. ORS 285]|nr:protein of unknown function [Bradyrhizobium sp. ORS 285]
MSISRRVARENAELLERVVNSPNLDETN